MKLATLAIAATMRLSAATTEEVTPLQRLRSQQSRHASSSEEKQRWGRTASFTDRRVLAGHQAPMSASMSMMSMADISMPSLAAMCTFCPNGLSDPDLVLPSEDTCTDAYDYSLGLAADNPECDYVKGAEFLCCPSSSVPPTTDAGAACSCSPVVYNFVITLGQDCSVDTVKPNPGIGQTFCFIGTTTPAVRRRLDTVSFNTNDNELSLTDAELQTMTRQLQSNITIISVQLIEFDTSGELIVINQDDTYSNVSLENGATVTFTSISSDMDPTLPVSDQPDLVPGGLQLVVKAEVTDGTTGEVMVVDNRVAWTYTNECGVDPIEVGEGVAWVTLVSTHVAFPYDEGIDGISYNRAQLLFSAPCCIAIPLFPG